MMWRTSLVAATLLCAVVVKAQVFFRGNCPKTPIIKDFDWERYLGRWYEQERYFVAYEMVGRCWSGTYIRDPKTYKISVRLDFRDIVLQKPKVLVVDILQKRPKEEPNRLTYTIPGVPVFEDDYEVLATDYDNWTLEYDCQNKPPFGHTRIAWILTRSRHPSQAVINTAKAKLTELGIDIRLLKRQDTSCFV